MTPFQPWFDLNFCANMTGLTLGFSLRTAGSRHVPPAGPALFLANHQSFLDPMIVGVAARRPLHYLARKTLFRHRLLAWYISSMHAVPIDQEGIGIQGLRTGVQILHEGKGLVIFPEGSRTPDGQVHPLLPGVHLLIKRAPAPIVPVGIAGAYHAWPIWRRYPIPAPLFLPATERTLAAWIGAPLDGQRLAAMPREKVLNELFDVLHAAHMQADRLRRKP